MATGSTQNIDLAYMDQSRPDLQVVKCVVVGDSGVGKTRLICARACGTKYALLQLIQTHVPTVWAIDHYRKDKEVLDRSWCTVDDVRVSLRLWDTFGYHDKDRRFAYGRADVILLCFSVVRPRSLRSAINHWSPEIRRICGNLPVILCGCQADLRYLYKDPHFCNITKGPFFKEIEDKDIITPEMGRAVAKEIGAFYYETSVLENYGIDDVFMNVIRGALTHKREKHFWNSMLGNLKRIHRPLPQPPLLPAKPTVPHVHVPVSISSWATLHELLHEQSYCDVVFVARGVAIQAHKAVLICAHPAFKRLFLSDCPSVIEEQTSGFQNQTIVLQGSEKTNKPTTITGFEKQHIVTAFDKQSHIKGNETGKQRRASLSYIPKKGKFVPSFLAMESVALLDYEEINSSLSSLSDTNKSWQHDISGSLGDVEMGSFCSGQGGMGSGSIGGMEDLLRRRVVSQSAVQGIQTQHYDDSYNAHLSPALKTVVTLSNDITPSAFQNLLTLLYTGRLPNDNLATDKDTLRAAELFGITEVNTMFVNSVNGEVFLNASVVARSQQKLVDNIHRLLIGQGYLADVWFSLDDGEVSAHKCLLMARCGMMCGMFSYNFRESAAKQVQFPGVSVRTFRALQEYLYCGECRHLQDVDYMELIELANRMCLDGLVAVAEQYAVQDLRRREESGANVMEEVLTVLELAQLHNAEQLAAYCLWFLCCNYTATYRRYSKIIRQLTPVNQIYLNNNRWPPLWYLKEVDFYDRAVMEEERTRQPPTRTLIRANSDDLDSGCLGFCGRKSRRMREVREVTRAEL